MTYLGKTAMVVQAVWKQGNPSGVTRSPSSSQKRKSSQAPPVIHSPSTSTPSTASTALASSTSANPSLMSASTIAAGAGVAGRVTVAGSATTGAATNEFSLQLGILLNGSQTVWLFDCIYICKIWSLLPLLMKCAWSMPSSSCIRIFAKIFMQVYLCW